MHQSDYLLPEFSGGQIMLSREGGVMADIFTTIIIINIFYLINK